MTRWLCTNTPPGEQQPAARVASLDPSSSAHRAPSLQARITSDLHAQIPPDLGHDKGTLCGGHAEWLRGTLTGSRVFVVGFFLFYFFHLPGMTTETGMF